MQIEFAEELARRRYEIEALTTTVMDGDSLLAMSPLCAIRRKRLITFSVLKEMPWH